MLNHFQSRAYTDCDALSEYNKENIGHFVRRPTASLRSEFDGTPVLLRRRTAYTSSRRTPSPIAVSGMRTRAITPQDATKKVMMTHKTKTKTKQQSQTQTQSPRRSTRCKHKATTKKVTARARSFGIIRRPLQDITHLYVNERASIGARRRERAARDALSTSVAMRFY